MFGLENPTDIGRIENTTETYLRHECKQTYTAIAKNKYVQ